MTLPAKYLNKEIENAQWKRLLVDCSDVRRKIGGKKKNMD